MYSGKLTFSTPSTQKKNHVKCWREKKISGKCILQKKNSRQMNGLKKNSCLQQFTQPSPPLLPLGPSKVKWLAPKCVQTSFMKRTLVVRFLQGAASSKQPLRMLSFWFFSYGKFKCSTSHLISHIKNGSGCFKHFSSHISWKMNLY